MTLRLLAALLLLASPALGQDLHPCDAAPATPVTLPLPVGPFAVGFCSDEADVAAYQVVIDGVVQADPGPAHKSDTANAAGLFFYESPQTITAAPGTHRMAVTVLNRRGAVSPSSDPAITFTVPGQVVTTSSSGCAAPTVLALRQCDLLEQPGAGFSISCSTRCAEPGAVQPEPEQPVVCTATPLTVTVKLWPSSSVGKSATLFYQATQNVATAVVSWVPKLALTVTDTRGCRLTVTK